MSGENHLQLAALDYAKQGWRVFPCIKRGKRPLIKNWQELATTDARVVQGWWKQWPDANVAVVTGASSGVFVLDVDGADGEVSLAILQDEHGPLPGTLESRTGGGGRHLFFKHDGTPVKNSTGKLGKGLDVRGDGGYVIVPPSVHETGSPYVWGGKHGRN
jgi:hypothetical protein